MLADALAAVRQPRRLRAPWHPVLGDHDLLVAGQSSRRRRRPRAIATGVARRLEAAERTPRPDRARSPRSRDRHPTGSADPTAIGRARLPAAGLGRRRRARRSQTGRALGVTEVDRPAAERERTRGGRGERRALRACAGAGGAGRLDYGVRRRSRRSGSIVLDLVRRERRVRRHRRTRPAGLARGGARGRRRPHDPRLLPPAAATRRPGAPGCSPSSTGHRGVLAAIWGHTHRNRITPRPRPGGGYWLISTASLIDFPQQSRALRVVETAAGVALETWMLDHVAPAGGLGRISRELSFLDAAGWSTAGLRRPAPATATPCSTSVAGPSNLRYLCTVVRSGRGGDTPRCGDFVFV